MKRWFLFLTVLMVVTGISLSAVPARADERHLSLGVGLSTVTSTERSLFGDKITIDRATMPEVNLTYFITDSWSVQASYGQYDAMIKSKDSDVNYGKLTVSPALLSLQYRHNYGNPPPYWDVASYYIGAGVGYFITNFDTNSSIKNSLADPTFNIKIKNSLGGNVGAGFDFFLNKSVSFSVDLKYWAAQSDIKYQGSGGTGKDHFDLNGWSVGAGFRFFL